jgi:hypothetical protein
VQDEIGRTGAELAVAIQSAYRHVIYPDAERIGLPDEEEMLGHVEIEATRTAVKPGDGQRAVAERLHGLGRMLQSGDHPPRPLCVEQRTPLRRGSITVARLRDEFRRDPSLPMLVDDDTFLRLLRQGIEEGRWVYQRGELVCAKDLPPAKLEIDEQSFVLTAKYAEENGIWPRPKPPEPPTEADGGPEPPTAGPISTTTEEPPTPPPVPEGAIEKEGVLREALLRVFEEARKRGWTAIGRLVLRPFDARDALTLAGLAAHVPDAQTSANGAIAYETGSGATCDIRFEGPLGDFRPVREFLQTALRQAKDTDTRLGLAFDFASGLPLEGTRVDDLVERLTRAGAGAAQVTAIAEAPR